MWILLSYLENRRWNLQSIMLGEQVYSTKNLSVTYFKWDLSILQSNNCKKSTLKQNLHRQIHKKIYSQLSVCSEIDWKGSVITLYR
jgi:hypothetical protein